MRLCRDIFCKTLSSGERHILGTFLPLKLYETRIIVGNVFKHPPSTRWGCIWAWGWCTIGPWAEFYVTDFQQVVRERRSAHISLVHEKLRLHLLVLFFSFLCKKNCVCMRRGDGMSFFTLILLPDSPKALDLHEITKHPELLKSWENNQMTQKRRN